MKIQFADLGLQHKEIKKEINLAIKRVLRNGDYILGKDVKEFEQEFSGFCQAKYGVGVCSGTDALFLALLAIGVKDGDEVIVPSFTYIATALAVSYTGAKPVFVDIEEDTYNINPGLIKKAITRNTKAIIPVHLYGQPANMNEILKIARENNLKVIEDAAQAHGAKIKMDNGNWSRTGGIGDIGCFSFYPSKNLGALGDGGLITTNDESIYKKLLMLRDYGRVSRYEHAIVGYNCRLDTIQAAILREKLKKLDGWNQMRGNAAKVYNAHFKSVKDVITPYVRPDVTHVYHCYVVRMPRRDRVFEVLNEKGVGAIIHYPIPLHLQKAYEGLQYKKGDFPVAEKVCSEIMSLPMYPHIKETQIKFIVNTIKRALRS
jgi:dTDP-4-amino-4,6-dideoxygalactose transaminase